MSGKCVSGLQCETHALDHLHSPAYIPIDLSSFGKSAINWTSCLRIDLYKSLNRHIITILSLLAVPELCILVNHFNLVLPMAGWGGIRYLNKSVAHSPNSPINNLYLRTWLIGYSQLSRIANFGFWVSLFTTLRRYNSINFSMSDLIDDHFSSAFLINPQKSTILGSSGSYFYENNLILFVM